MCYFVTIGCDAAASDALRGAIPRGLMLAPVVNRSVLAQLPANFETFVLMSGMCSCDLFRVQLDPVLGPTANERRKKYEKRGWPEAKIARALADAEAHRKPPSGFIGLRSDVRELLATVAESIGELAVFGHWYDDGVETARIALTSGPRVSSDELRELALPEATDQWVTVRRRPG